MAKDSNVRMDGVVENILGGDFFHVRMNGTVMKCKLGGKLRKNKIRIVTGDTVEVEVSPYSDTNSIGLIQKRK